MEKNLVYRAVDALRPESRVPPGVELTLRKKIPAGRGLGGGSSDARRRSSAICNSRVKSSKPPRLLDIASSLGPTSRFFCLVERPGHR